MFKLSPPTMKVILSSGSFLTLIALGCLVVMSTSVHTSDIQIHSDEINGKSAATTTTTPGISETSTASNSEQDVSVRQETTPVERQASSSSSSSSESRHRSGRMYQSHAQQHQQSPLESYADAYAAANSGGGADQSALTQQSVAVGSQSSSDSSFGEAPPSLSTAAGGASSPQSISIARQLPTSPMDYASHSNYFAGYMSPSSNEASYTSGVGLPNYVSPANHHMHHYHHKAHHYHQQQQHQQHQHQSSPVGLPLGYPTTNGMPYEQRAFSPISSSYYDRIAHSSAAAASSPFWATSSLPGSSGTGGGGGLMSSATHALSHWTNGFSIGEIICGLVAIAIGAIILGAPFFLIYLALMGNFSGSGTLSLTNPTSATGAAGGATAPANGRRKRLAVFEAMNMDEQASDRHPDMAAMVESVAKSLGPYVNLEQVSSTFKQLVKSIEKYSTTSASQNERAKRLVS